MRVLLLAFSLLLLPSSEVRADTCIGSPRPPPGPIDLSRQPDFSTPADLSDPVDGGLLGLGGRAGKRRVGLALLCVAPLGLLWLGLRQRRPGDSDIEPR